MLSAPKATSTLNSVNGSIALYLGHSSSRNPLPKAEMLADFASIALLAEAPERYRCAGLD